jgi:hypothetical protein
MSDTAGGDRAESKRHVAVVVVHGVGDTEPGTTVNYIVQAMCDRKDAEGKPTSTAAECNEVYRLPEHPGVLVDAEQRKADRKRLRPGQPRPDPIAFPVFARGVELTDGTKASFMEMHWSDLTKKDQGFLNTAVTFARFIFEIPHVIDGFLREPAGLFSRVLRALLLIITCFVRGPLAGYSAVMLAGGLIFLSFDQIPEREDVVALFSGIWTFAKAFFGSLLPSGVVEEAWHRLPETPTAWFPVVFLVVLSLAIFGCLLMIVLGLARFLRHPIVISAAACVFAIASFYLVDMQVLRPSRYARYAGISYHDYLSVMMFVIGWIGFHILLSRRKLDVGFADLGLFTGIWAFAFVFDLSPLGDKLRAALPPALRFGSGVPLQPGDIHSSTIHFKAFDHYYPLLKWLWAIWGALMLIAVCMAIALFVVRRRDWSKSYRGIFAAIALATAQSCVWLTVLPALAVMHMDDVLCRGNRYSVEKEPVGCQTKLRENREVLELLRAFQTSDEGRRIGALPILPKPLDTVVEERERPLHTPMLTASKELALSFVWHSGILLVAFVIGLVIAGWRATRAWIGRLRHASIEVPRLIIHSSALVWLGLFGLVNALLCFIWVEPWQVTGRVMSGVGLGSIEKLHVPAEIVQMALLSSTIVLLLTQIDSIKMAFSSALGIMQDLIDHQYRLGTSFVGRVTRSRNDTPIRRERITARLDVVMQRLVQGKGYDDVLFLAHSQGTVIVFDYLRSGLAKQRFGDLRPHVISAGSPIGALYEYYFNEYGDVGAAMARMQPQPASWTNFYRLDDPIAGTIVADADSAQKIKLENVDIGLGGHLRYWPNQTVCEAIMKRLKGA